MVHKFHVPRTIIKSASPAHKIGLSNGQETPHCREHADNAALRSMFDNLTAFGQDKIIQTLLETISKRLYLKGSWQNMAKQHRPEAY